MKELLHKLKSYFYTGHSRSMKIKKNVAFLFILKGADVITSFLFLPLTLQYVEKEVYGIWVTLISVIGWFSLMDIGINNGLRNKFAAARANEDNESAQKYVSTSYFMLTIIFSLICGIYFLLKPYLHWDSILKIVYPADELSHVVSIIVIFFCMRFILQTINIINIADQKPALSSLINFISHFISLGVIFLLVNFTNGSLVNLCYGLCIPPIFVLLFFNIYLFNTKYKNIKPVFSKINPSLIKNLLNLGIVFFIIQVAMIIQFQTSNLIIIRSFGETDVTIYNIAQKYFSSLIMILSIILMPLWSSATDAYTRNDIQWIEETTKKYNKILYGLLLLGIILLIISPVMYKLWLGKQDFEIPFLLSVVMLLYTSSLMYGRVQGTILNGIGALKLQMLTSIISPFIFIGLCFVFIFILKLGLISVLVAGIIANFNRYLIAPIQYKMIFKYNKKGIWIK